MNRKIGVSTILMGVLLSSSVLFASCVTVNVHFPEGAVQQAADDYVKELYKAKEDAEKKEGKTSLIQKQLLPLWAQLILPVAHAEDFKVNSPKAKSILAAQKGRISKIVRYKKMGAIGEGDKGLLAVKDLSKVTNAIEKKRVQKLVDKENADRNSLYKEVISSNGLNGAMEMRVRTIFHDKFLGADPSGSPYKVRGQWKTK